MLLCWFWDLRYSPQDGSKKGRVGQEGTGTCMNIGSMY